VADRRVLISCGGLGMGNASRVFAIAQAIGRKWPGAEVHFFTWGKGHAFLAKAATSQAGMRLHALEPYPWLGRSRIPLLRSLHMLALFTRAYLRNTFILRRAMRELDPDVVLLDSDYHFASFFGRRGKLFYLGQAIDVVDRARRLGYRPRGLVARLSFLACEVVDGLLQRLMSDRVFVPSFLETESPPGSGRALRIPLIVREEFRHASDRSASVKTVAVTSGSGIESERIDGLVAAIGGSLFSAPRGDSRLTSPEDFQAGEFVVIQGGLTSISECIALGRPMLVVPIRGRAEQEVNARTVESLGLGISCERGDLQAARQGGLRASENPAGTRILVHGADVVAGHVFADA
jgi:hypothetical protein